MENESTNTLDLLGVRNSSVFLSNCTIWVEGITDRYYLRRYLEIYQEGLPDGVRRFKEDLHYSFIEYGGSNLPHWSLLEDVSSDEDPLRPMTAERISNRLVLITDRDVCTEALRGTLARRLGDNYYCLECKEVENLLRANVVKGVIADYEGVDPAGLELTHDFDEMDYKNEGLGAFIERSLKNRKRRGSYEGEYGGTVSDKVNFCRKALNHIRAKEDISLEAWNLCEKLYSFISQHNK